VEVNKGQISRLASPGVREQVVSKLKSLGFKYVTLDLAGYETGSFNPKPAGKEPRKSGARGAGTDE
jgi:uncharacterized protein